MQDYSENTDKKEIKVSVIIPIYNAYDYLRPALDSVIDQTFPDMEIICIDDGSTDGSLDIIKEYQKRDSRVRIVTETNAGPALARNNGLKRARGKYVIFLDADDFFELTLIEKLYNEAEEKQLDIAIARYDIYNSKKAAFRENVESDHGRIYTGGTVTSKNEHPNYILQSTTGSAWNKLFRKRFLIDSGITFLTEVKMFEDVYFTVCAMAFAERVGKLPEVLIHHRIYNEQSRARMFKKYYAQVPEVYLKIKEFLMKNGLYEPLVKSYLNLSCSRCYHIYNLLWTDAKENFWNLLHDKYAVLLGWNDHPVTDFEKTEVCEFCANVEMYTHEQYERRNSRGRKLTPENVDRKLARSYRRKKFRSFMCKLCVIKRKDHKEA